MSSGEASIALSCPVVRAVWCAKSAGVPYVCADLPSSADDAPLSRTTSSKYRVGDNIPRRFDDRRTRSRRGSTNTGYWLLPRNDDPPPEILHSSREPEIEREHIIDETCRIRTVTDNRLRLQDKSTGASRRLSCCLHIQELAPAKCSVSPDLAYRHDDLA